MFKRLIARIMKPGRGKRAFVGVSGGVDSSAAAALLQEQGYDVVGVFIRTWQPDWVECTWRDERRDAMRACAHLGIPFVELDLEKQYKEGVADYMVSEYAKGRTPNPDVMCNREVKFGGFYDWARKQGADVVATGHYARTTPSFRGGARRAGVSLLKGIDSSKDQSYFLWTLTPDQLKNIVFPVGHLEKSEVRRIAQRLKLPVATKKDSQGICFIGDVDMKEFLAHYFEQKEGSVVDEKGNVIGTHKGAVFFTIGERHGFTIVEKGTNDAPYYIVSKDMKANTVTVSQHPEQVQKKDTRILEACVWREKILDQKYSAHIRYHGKDMPCMIKELDKDKAKISFENPDFSLASGQSVVVYDGDICVGGGIVA